MRDLEIPVYIVVWTCLVCDAPNFSYTLFDLHDIESRNRFSVLSHSSGSDESFESVNSHCDLGHPKAASSPVKPKPRPSSGPRPLRILNVNCQSLKKKKGPLYNILDSTKPDIIILTETWFNSTEMPDFRIYSEFRIFSLPISTVLFIFSPFWVNLPKFTHFFRIFEWHSLAPLNSSICDAEYFNSQYTIYRSDRPSESAGGVIVAINSDFVSTRVESLETESSEAIWVKINITGCKTLYVGGCYRAHVSDEVSIEDLDTVLRKIASRTNNIVLAGGDFNFPGWDWKKKCLKPKTPYPRLHYKFGEILDDNGITQIVEEPTRLDNTLDLILTNRPNQINRTQVIPGISDHEAVFTEFNVKLARKKQVPCRVPLYKKAG